jgi:hypothetical protein
MKRKCLSMMVLLVLMMLFGCATSQDIANKKSSGEATNVSYDYPWEKVYDAYHYVLENTAMSPVNIRTSSPFSHTKYLKMEKLIMVMNYALSTKHVELAMYFTAEGDNKTKVAIVGGTTLFTTYTQRAAIRQIVDEVAFVLKNDGKGYNDYSTANSLKWEDSSQTDKGL